ncbi:MAG: hypothetical protein ACRD0H_29935, partial [Actinomycetes bacterium]
MTAIAGRRRALLMIGVAGLLCMTGPGWPVAAAPGSRPPGVPPPVDATALPTQADVDAPTYVVRNQVGPVKQRVACRSPSAVVVKTEPAGQARLRIRQAHQFATGHG